MVVTSTSTVSPLGSIFSIVRPLQEAMESIVMTRAEAAIVFFRFMGANPLGKELGVDTQEFYAEDKGGVRLNSCSGLPLFSVGEVARDEEYGYAARFHQL